MDLLHSDLIPPELRDYVDGELQRRKVSKATTNARQAAKPTASPTTTDSVRNTVPTTTFLPSAIAVTGLTTPGDELIRSLASAKLPEAAGPHVPRAEIQNADTYNAIVRRIMELEEKVPRGVVLEEHNSGYNIVHGPPTWVGELFEDIAGRVDALIEPMPLDWNAVHSASEQRIGQGN